MQGRYQHARQQAIEARDRALFCRDRDLRDEWSKVALYWDLIAGELEELTALKGGVAANENAD